MRHAVSSIEALISFGTAQGFGWVPVASSADAPVMHDTRIAAAAAIATTTRDMDVSPINQLRSVRFAGPARKTTADVFTHLVRILVKCCEESQPERWSNKL